MEKQQHRRPRVGWVLAGLTAAALSCNVLSPATATPVPLPPPTTPPATLSGPTPTLPPAPTDTASPATATADGAVTAAPTPELPQEAILILEPALAASVTSLVHVAGDADPTFEQNLVVHVYDESGTVLATQPTTLQSEAGQRGPFDIDVAFSVAASQPGRISVADTSARDGGLLHLASVEVILLASGSAAVVPGQPHQEAIVIDTPTAGASVSGGSLHVTGFSLDPIFENQMALTLCGEGGSGGPDLVCGTTDNILAQGVAAVTPPELGQPGPFAGDLTYSISAPVQGRLAVYYTSPRDGGIVHLASINLQLQP